MKSSLRKENMEASLKSKGQKSLRKNWKPNKRGNSSKIEINDETIDGIFNSINLDSNTPGDFLESFCHKYTNINSSIAGGVTERMLADIEKREKKQQELEKAEQLYQVLHQRPLDNKGKEELHNRLYIDAFYRAHKLNEEMIKKEEIEARSSAKRKRTASKKRIEQFVNKVNHEILEKKKILESKRKIKELEEELEYQKLKNRRISKGKMSKSRERELAKKLMDYENK